MPHLQLLRLEHLALFLGKVVLPQLHNRPVSVSPFRYRMVTTSSVMGDYFTSRRHLFLTLEKTHRQCSTSKVRQQLDTLAALFCERIVKPERKSSSLSLVAT